MLAHLRHGARFAPLIDHRPIVVHGKAQAFRCIRRCHRLFALHERAQLRDEPRVAERGATEHHRIDAALAHARERQMRIGEVAVADHRNVDRALEFRDARPIRAAFVKLFCRARVQRDGLHADALRALRYFDEDHLVIGPTQAHLHRDRAIDGLDDRFHDRLAAIHIAQARAAAFGFRYLGRGAAKIDVHDIRAAFAHDFCRLGHDRRIVAPELRRDGLLDPVLIDHLHRALRAVLERI